MSREAEDEVAPRLGPRPGGLDRVDHAVQLLEDEWRKHGDVPLERLWAEQKRLLESDADESIVLLSELIKTDLRCRFARGQTPDGRRLPRCGSRSSSPPTAGS